MTEIRRLDRPLKKPWTCCFVDDLYAGGAWEIVPPDPSYVLVVEAAGESLARAVVEAMNEGRLTNWPIHDEA